MKLVGKFALILLSGSLAAGCHANLSSPTTSAPTLDNPSQLPSPVTFTLTGRVTESPPTSKTGIGGATVAVMGTSGISTTTSWLGFYSIPDVAPGSTVRVSAEGFVDVTTISGRGILNLELMPVPQLKETTLSDVLSPDVGTCSDGVSMRPCHILTIGIHNSGPFDATLTWDPSDAADLDLTLFRTGDSTAIARSTSKGGEPERITALLSDGATYELRITYASGSGAPTYTLHAKHQN